MNQLMTAAAANDYPRTNFEDVVDFSTKFKLPCPAWPQLLEPDVFKFRLGFLREELEEIVAAPDLPTYVDGCIDLAYVTLGTCYFHGSPWWGRTWREIHDELTLAGFEIAEEPAFPHWRDRQEQNDVLLHKYAQYERAHRNSSLGPALRALFDLGDCAIATCLQSGAPWQPCWKEVQDANMRKTLVPIDELSSAKKHREHRFDVRKPPGWVGPDLVRVLREAGWQEKHQ